MNIESQLQSNIPLLPAWTLTRPAPVDQLTALRQIEAAFQAWETAYFAGRYEEAGRLSAIHDRLFDEHMARLFPRKPAMQPAAEIVTAPVIAETAPIVEVPQPAHMTDARRKVGTITAWYPMQQFGEILCGDVAYNFSLRSVLGMGMAYVLKAGVNVSFAAGVDGRAASVVVTGNDSSEKAYGSLRDKKAAYKAVNSVAQANIDARLAQSRSHQRVGHVQLTSDDFRSFFADIKNKQGAS